MKKPNFMCIGAPKCGTTTLYDILKQHPDVYVPSFKEPNFFNSDGNYAKGFSWYLSEFFSGVKNESSIGEFTPGYFVDDNAPERIFKELGGELKLVLLLRNPVDRAYSQYLHAKRDLDDELDFFNALEAESDRINQLKWVNPILCYKLSYIQNSLYHSKLENWLQYFSMDNIKIFIFEDEFLMNRSEMISELSEFLGVSVYELNLNINSNVASVTKFEFLKEFLRKKTFVHLIAKKYISFEFRQIIKNKLMGFANKPKKVKKLDYVKRKEILNNYFINDIEALEELTGRDLSVWKL